MWTWTEFFGGKTCCPLDIEGSYFAFEIAQDGFLQKCSRKLELNAIYFEPFQKFSYIKFLPKTKRWFECLERSNHTLSDYDSCLK